MTSDAPNAAREALDTAIRDYCASCDTTADEQGPFVPTGWVLIASGIRAAFNNDDGTSYIKEAMPGQPWHAALGLWIKGADDHRYGSPTSRPDID